MRLPPDAILTVCRAIGDTAWRDRLLTPVTTMPLVLWQMLHGHTAGSHLPHLSGWRFPAAADGHARAKLPRRLCARLRARFGRAVQRSALDDGRWQGHRTCLVDGSGWSRPETPTVPGRLRPADSTAWLARETLGGWPEALVRREVRYGIGTPGFGTRQMTLVTTRLDAEVYRVADLAERYRQRGQVETSLAYLKTTMQMDVLHGQIVPGVRKELTVFAIVYNLVRMSMCQAATLQRIGVARISFVEALRWLGAPSTGVPLGALIVTPVRPYRVEPRVKKRRPKSFPFMLTPRQALRQQLVQQKTGA